MISIVIEFILEQCKQLVIGSDKFLPVFLCHPGKMTDHPACRFELPLICQTNKAVIGCDIGKEWKLSAAQRPEFALALRGTQAGKQNHALWCICFEMGNFLRSCILAFCAAPFVPEISITLEIFPFTFVGSRDGVTDVTAKWLAAWIMGRAFLSAIELRDRRVKFIVERLNIVWGKIRDRFENRRGTIKHGTDSNKKREAEKSLVSSVRKLSAPSSAQMLIPVATGDGSVSIEN